MHKKFKINQTKIKGSCQSGGKVVAHNSKSDLPLIAHSMYICYGAQEDRPKSIQSAKLAKIESSNKILQA